jgi:hypothetical protein
MKKRDVYTAWMMLVVAVRNDHHYRQIGADDEYTLVSGAGVEDAQVSDRVLQRRA